MEKFKKTVVVEIPKNTKEKFEFCFTTNGFVQDRVIDVEYPANYGFIPNTIAEDGDPSDVFIFSPVAYKTGTVLEVVVFGIIHGTDDGINDHKLLSFPSNSRVEEVSRTSIDQVVDFLNSYKPGFKVTGIYGVEKAYEYCNS